eukprot:scaffold2326_cov171-Amphora_coffeaeformis.AAC.1
MEYMTTRSKWSKQTTRGRSIFEIGRHAKRVSERRGSNNDENQQHILFSITIPYAIVAGIEYELEHLTRAWMVVEVTTTTTRFLWGYGRLRRAWAN